MTNPNESEAKMTPSKERTGWWTRPSGGFDVLWFAVPLVISAGSSSLMNFTDRMFLMWYSPDAMTASFQAGLLFWTAVSLPMSVAAYTNTFVSQYYGSGSFHRIGPVVWQGIGFGFLMIPVFYFLEPLGEHVFRWFGHHDALIPLEISFLKIILYGSGATIAGEAAASFFYGRGKMQVVMHVNVFAVFVNIVLDYCWIFGHFGFPAMGLEGAAYATTISQWIRLFLFIGLMFLADAEEKRYGILVGMKPDISLVARLFYYGGASGTHIFMDTVCFTLFSLMVGGLGKIAADATTIAFTLNMFTFLPVVGTGIAVSTMVGNQLGYNRPDLAERAAITATILCSVYVSCFGLIFLLGPDILLSRFATFTDPKEFEAVHDIAVNLLRFVAFYLLFDGFSIIFSSAIKGAGDTWFVLKVTFLLAPLPPILSFVGIKFFGLGLYWCWIVLTSWVCISGTIFIIRFLNGKWKRMRVIEKEFLRSNENQ